MMCKIILALAGIFFSAALIQIGFFLWITNHKAPLQSADLIVVFTGDRKRIEAGCALAEEGYAANLSVVNYTHEQLQKMTMGRKDLSKVTMITSGKGGSTFEDVYNTKEIISRHKFQSVILVTSSYHIPRALFLLKTFLVISGLKVDVQFYPVKFVSGMSTSIVFRLCYNEMVKLWGSSIEMVVYKLTHTVLMKKTRYLETKKYIKTRLLFKT